MVKPQFRSIGSTQYSIKRRDSNPVTGAGHTGLLSCTDLDYLANLKDNPDGVYIVEIKKMGDASTNAEMLQKIAAPYTSILFGLAAPSQLVHIDPLIYEQIVWLEYRKRGKRPLALTYDVSKHRDVESELPADYYERAVRVAKIMGIPLISFQNHRSPTKQIDFAGVDILNDDWKPVTTILWPEYEKYILSLVKRGV